jgi:hypothetical protein
MSGSENADCTEVRTVSNGAHRSGLFMRMRQHFIRTHAEMLKCFEILKR